jgi:hypothetical protein
MGLFEKKTPWEKEWQNLLKKEAQFTAKRKEGPTSVLVKKLDKVVPEKLSGTLNAAYFKAFQIVFEKGTSVIEKTYNKGKKEQEFKVNTYAQELAKDTKSARQFTKQARSTKGINLAISGIEGIGMGIVGSAIPDIPVFIAMVLKSIYEIALSYGYEYTSDAEKIFILKIIETSMCDEEAFTARDAALNEDIHAIVEAGDYIGDGDWTISKEEQMKLAAHALSEEMIYTKFLQGFFVVGLVGGIFDPVYVNRISDYAVLKYRRRFLEGKLAEEKHSREE